ncbi:hypothetical protein SAMN05216417_10181 [Nitrosospira multiformis]|uniref:Uncharacterized protein n=1 Tax=Nitrosospira multiformis TaxID=1231 RepID=A0A1I7F324_9PROT|nr:hypothetical protein SAMN05216417_10181 [Nitrosospira multiformis]
MPNGRDLSAAFNFSRKLHRLLKVRATTSIRSKSEALRVAPVICLVCKKMFDMIETRDGLSYCNFVWVSP